MRAKECFGTVLLSVVVFSLSVREVSAGAAAEWMGKLPADTLFAAAWSGTESLTPAFEQSYLGQIWKDPQVQAFYQAILHAIRNRAASEDPNAIRRTDCLLNLVQLSLRKPLAIGVCSGSEDPAEVSVFFVLQAGADKAKFEAALTEAFRELHFTPFAVPLEGTGVWTIAESYEKFFYWTWLDTVLAAAFNDPQGRLLKTFGKGQTLSDRNPLSGFSERTEALVLYGDFALFFSKVRARLQTERSGEDAETFAKILSQTGLDRVRRFVMCAGFEGKNFGSESRLMIDGGSGGLLSNLGTVKTDVLCAADERAFEAFAFSLSWAGLYDGMHNFLKSVLSEEDYQEFCESLSGAEEQTGFSIRRDLLDNLTGPVLGYLMPAYTVSQVPQGGTVFMADIKSADTMEKVLNQLGAFVQKEAPDQFQIQTQTLPEGGSVCVWVHPMLALAQVMPSWAICNSKLIVATHPVLAKETLLRLQDSSAAGGLCRREKFSSVRSVYPASAVFLSYADTALQVRQGLMQLQQVWPMLAMAAAQEGFLLPMMLPNLEPYISQFPPSVGYMVQDSRGLQSRYIGPGLDVGAASVAGVAAGTAILMPAVNKSRQTAQRVVSGTNLRNIWLALQVYATKHNGPYPPDLQTLVREADLNPKVLQNPYPKPDSFSGPDYVYIAGQNRSCPPGNVLAYENPQFGQSRVNVLYADGRVEAIDLARLQKEVRETYENLKRPIPSEEAACLGLDSVPPDSDAEK
ncbi:MAG: hypothetical protein WHS88_01325 [Anaerohalosphaeraceae bacterium]